MHSALFSAGVRPFLATGAVQSRRQQVPAPRRTLVIENAHKKGAGSSKNGRDSNPKSRGVKVYGGQPVRHGGIIVRQLGNKWHAGRNVSTGNDFTLFSMQDGIVVFETIKQKKCVSVYPPGHEKTAGLKLARKPDGRAAKRIEAWRGTARA